MQLTWIAKYYRNGSGYSDGELGGPFFRRRAGLVAKKEAMSCPQQMMDGI